MKRASKEKFPAAQLLVFAFSLAHTYTHIHIQTLKLFYVIYKNSI